jgi:hypothetical protein
MIISKGTFSPNVAVIQMHTFYLTRQGDSGNGVFLNYNFFQLTLMTRLCLE